jgi:DNA polymerase I
MESVDRPMLEYNALDAAATYEIYEKLWTEAQKTGYLPQYDFLERLLEPLLAMQIRGILVNQEGLEETKERISQEIVQKQEELDQACGMPLNTASPKQCIAYFYGLKALKPYISRSTGNPTCDDTAMQRLARKGVKEARLVQELRGLRKLKGTYLDILLDSDGRLRCNIN